MLADEKQIADTHILPLILALAVDPEIVAERGELSGPEGAVGSVGVGIFNPFRL